MIVERRDHVLITFLSPLSSRTWTFLRRCSSTNGPFFTERGILLPSFLHDVLISSCVMSGLEAFGKNAPWALRMIPFSSSFSTTHGMVDWVHCDSTNVRSSTQPTCTT